MNGKRIAGILAVGMTLAACGGCTASLVSERPTPAADAPAAHAYYTWLLDCIDALERDLPRIAACADAVARRYVIEEDYQLGAAGDMGFGMEAGGRSGGMMRMQLPHQVGEAYRGAVLFALEEDKLDANLKQIAELREQGATVIAFGRRAVLQRAREAGAAFDLVVENHAAPEGGLFHDPGGRCVVPTDPVANIAALWTWTGEFVAGCTRYGKMPPMYLGFAVPGGRERAQRMGHGKFHTKRPVRVERCVLGGEYLRELRRDLAAVHAAEMADIHAVAVEAVRARDYFSTAYVFAHGHAILRRLGCACDPGYFAQINKDWFTVKDDVQPRSGDFIFCLGFDSLFRGGRYGDFIERARGAGATLAWSITSYKQDDVAAIPPDEVFIDQHWRFGDAVVSVPGYDIKILPTSAVLAEAILWMVNAEVNRIYVERADVE